MPIFFTDTQINIIQAQLPFYKEYCALISMPKTRNSDKIEKQAQKLARDLSAILSPMVDTIYGRKSQTHLEPIEIHLVFRHFFVQQIAAINTLDTKIAKKSVAMLKEQFTGLPKRTEEDLLLELEQVERKIDEHTKKKSEIYQMSVPERQLRILSCI